MTNGDPNIAPPSAPGKARRIDARVWVTLALMALAGIGSAGYYFLIPHGCSPHSVAER
jgi:hypothetical protein